MPDDPPPELPPEGDPGDPLGIPGATAVLLGGVDVTAGVMPDGMTITTCDPGGFGSCTLRLKATTAGWTGPYAAGVVKGATAIVTNAGTTMFEGVITNDVSHAIVEDGTAFYEVTCGGLYWKAAQREDFAHVYSDNDITQWFPSPTACQDYEVAVEGKLGIRLPTGQSTYANAKASIFYWLKNGMDTTSANSVAYFIARLDYNVGSTNWYADVSSCGTNPWGTWTVQQTWNNVSGTGFTILPMPAGTRAVRVRLYTTSAITSATVDRYFDCYDVAIMGTAGGYWSTATMTSANPTTVTTASTHGLATGDKVAIKRASGATGPHGWYTVTVTGSTTFTVPVLGDAAVSLAVLRGSRVSDAMKWTAGGRSAVSANLATSTTGDDIGALRYDLTARPHTSRAAAIDAFGILNVNPIGYGFWENSTFKCAVRTTPPATSDYLIDATAAGFDYSVFKATEDSPSAVKVLFRSGDTVSTSLPDGLPSYVYAAADPGYTANTSPVAVWDEFSDVVMTPAQATDIGNQILAWIGANIYEGTIRISVHLTPLRGGGTKSTAYIRSGEYIEASNYATGRLLITQTSLDVYRSVMTLTIGETRRDFVARIKAASKPRTWGEWDTWDQYGFG